MGVLPSSPAIAILMSSAQAVLEASDRSFPSPMNVVSLLAQILSSSKIPYNAQVRKAAKAVTSYRMDDAVVVG